MVTSQFDAEFGSTSGGVVNAVSKQGTNQFRGSALGFCKNTPLTSKALNVTNRSNDVNPEGDARRSNFLVVTALQGNGPTRTAQLGIRLTC
jgi:hypothetical protein